MISLRARAFGEDEWTATRFDGEDEQKFLDILADALLCRELHVQVLLDGKWEDATL